MDTLKPYLIRAIYEWVLDNSFTPYLLVNAEHPNAIVPMEFVNNGSITLNIKPAAVEALCLGNSLIEFNARFNGKATYISVPISAVLAIYAKENGKGMIFDKEENEMIEESESISPTTNNTPEKTKPTLRVIK